MSHIFDFVEGDTGSTLQVTCVDQDGTAINLTDATVRLYWGFSDGDGMHSATMTITDAANGVVEYKFVNDDVVKKQDLHPGTLTAEVEIIDSGGLRTTSMTELVYEVRKRINLDFQ